MTLPVFVAGFLACLEESLVRQRNAGVGPLLVMLDPPVEVAAGEEIDHDVLLAGFEPVASSPSDPPAAVVAADRPVKKSPVAATAPDAEEAK